jgi:hypothetical protein
MWNNLMLLALYICIYRFKHKFTETSQNLPRYGGEYAAYLWKRTAAHP